MLKLAIEGQGHAVIEARDQGEAMRALQERPALVLTDLRLPEGDGFGVLRAAKELDPELPVIVMTAYGSIQDAVAAMKEGALDFLAKPIDPDHLLLMIDRALTQRRVMTEYILLREELAARRGAPQIIGDSPALKHAIVALQRAAGSDATVLLEGESGTGKELFARALHALSGRADGPFVAINCAAIPENLLETELFGHEKGAFTGAVARKLGKFEIAHRGTLFLDEIGDLPLALQAKILRVLEDRRFERVGGTQSLQVDVRIVAATNKALRAGVAAKLFREDLFFRLSVFPIAIPPLRDRPIDIPILARHFVERFCRELKKTPAMLAPSAIDELQKYHWPGNVRELQNCIERAVILSETDAIHARHLNLMRQAQIHPEPSDPWTTFDLSGTLSDVTRRAVVEVERRKIEAALKDAGGNEGRAADILGIGYKPLLAKIKEYGIRSSGYQPQDYGHWLMATSLLQADLFQRLPQLILAHIRNRRPAANACAQHVVQGSADDLLVVLRGFEHFFGREIRNRGKRPEVSDNLRQRAPIVFGHDAAGDGNLGGDQHAVGNRLAVTEALVFGHRFERVTGRVAEVQHAPRARLALVESNHLRLDRARFPDHGHERVCLAREDRAHLPIDALEETAARGHRVFDHLVEAGAEFPARQGFEQCRIRRHERGLMERTDQIFPERMIDAHLAADRAVDLSEQCRRHVDQRDAAQVSGRDEAGHVSDDAAPHRDDGCAAIGFELDQRFVGAGSGRELFVLLTVGKEDRVGLGQRSRDGPAVQLPDERARDDEVTGSALRGRLDEPSQLRGHSMFDVDGILVGPGLHIYAKQCVK